MQIARSISQNHLCLLLGMVFHIVMDSSLVREYYDHLEPILVSDSRSDYSGCVLIAHPSLVLVDAVYPEREGFEGAHYPAFVVCSCM